MGLAREVLAHGTRPQETAKAVLYARVSSKEQREEGFSIEAQVRLLRDYAAKEGLVIAEEFIDVESASKSGRPRFNAMLAYLRKNPTCRTVLCEKTDRLYRNLKDYATLDVKEWSLNIHLVKENESSAPSRSRASNSCMASGCSWRATTARTSAKKRSRG